MCTVPTLARRRIPVALAAFLMLAGTAVTTLSLSLVWAVATASPVSAQSHTITLPIDPSRIDDVHWTDSWGAARSGGRSHIGVDMMGPKMVPLRAAADAVVTWGRYSNSRGSIIRLRADDGWEYQYIHINNDTPGTDDGAASCTQSLSEKLCNSLESNGDIRRGTRVSAGEVIAYLGDSGNAEWTGSHLHFEVYAPSGDGVVAVNPTPYVDAAAAAVRAGNDVGTTGGAGAGDGSDEFVITDDMSEDEKLEVAVEAVSGNPATAQLDRLYLAFFHRQADDDGLDYWIDRHGRGHSLADIAEWFARSDEFQQRYGDLDFADFLDQLYVDVLERRPDDTGKGYWLDRLEAGNVNRGTIVVWFTEGSELRGRSEVRNELTVLARLFGYGVPTEADQARWAEFRSGRDLETAIQLWFLSESPMM